MSSFVCIVSELLSNVTLLANAPGEGAPFDALKGEADSNGSETDCVRVRVGFILHASANIISTTRVLYS